MVWLRQIAQNLCSYMKPDTERGHGLLCQQVPSSAGRYGCRTRMLLHGRENHYILGVLYIVFLASWRTWIGDKSMNKSPVSAKLKSQGEEAQEVWGLWATWGMTLLSLASWILHLNKFKLKWKSSLSIHGVSFGFSPYPFCTCIGKKALSRRELKKDGLGWYRAVEVHFTLCFVSY